MDRIDERWTNYLEVTNAAASVVTFPFGWKVVAVTLLVLLT
jgi:hypothetical protein